MDLSQPSDRIDHGHLFPDLDRDQVASPATIDLAVAQTRTWLRNMFASPDAYHGEAHAEDVLRHCLAIADHLQYPLSAIERLVLNMAALLHDVGYTAYQPSWAANRREHVPASIAFAERHLPQLNVFANHPELVTAVTYLIGYHDDTGYKFPSAVWDGFVGSIELGPYSSQLTAFGASLPAAQVDRLHLLLAILREADALTAAGVDGAMRTYQYALHRALPEFAAGNPLNAWCWEECAAGNTRLAAKRALIDAMTSEGKDLAVASYRATEGFLQAVCIDRHVPYETETLDSFLFTLHDPVSPHSSFEVVRYQGWDTLLHTLSATSDDLAAKPIISARRLPVASLPGGSAPTSTAHYAELVEVQAHLLAEYASSLFDLTGILEYKLNGTTAQVRPPVLERRVGSSKDPASKDPAPTESLRLVDGAATIALAQALRVAKLWIVEIIRHPAD